MQLHRIDGGDVSSPEERRQRALVSICRGFEQALAELDPSDPEYPRVASQARMARIAARIPAVRSVG
ncbi:MAG: hypothetical protein ACSLFR_08700 [Solirubrobacteraceae bacterium]